MALAFLESRDCSKKNDIRKDHRYESHDDEQGNKTMVAMMSHGNCFEWQCIIKMYNYLSALRGPVLSNAAADTHYY